MACHIASLARRWLSAERVLVFSSLYASSGGVSSPRLMLPTFRWAFSPQLASSRNSLIDMSKERFVSQVTLGPVRLVININQQRDEKAVKDKREDMV